MIRNYIVIFILISLSACTHDSGVMTSYVPHDKMARQNAKQGLSYLQQGYTDQAQQALLLAAQQSPNDPVVLDSLGYYYEKTGMIDQANHYFLQALLAAPDSPTAQNNYGAFLCRNGQYQTAIRYFLAAAQTPDTQFSRQAYKNAVYCAQQMQCGLGDRAAYAYYMQLIRTSQTRRTHYEH